MGSAAVDRTYRTPTSRADAPNCRTKQAAPRCRKLMPSVLVCFFNDRLLLPPHAYQTRAHPNLPFPSFPIA